MNYYVYYRKASNHGSHDDVAICEAYTLNEAVQEFRKYYINALEEDVRKVDLHREGYAKGIMIVSDY